MIRPKPILVLVCLIQTTSISLPPLSNVFVVWSVGQGAWSTWVDLDRCIHIDMGGEKNPTNQVAELCRTKENYILLTHLDWDHINRIAHFVRNVEQSCIYYPKAHSNRVLRRISQCSKVPDGVMVVSSGSQQGSRNSQSIVYLLHHTILVTGDAPMAEERKWYRKLPRKLAVLVLGHHGSATSTSRELLEWARPRQVVASARKARYGHPHLKIIRKLRKAKIPLLRSEILGHIYFKIEGSLYKERIPSQDPKLQLRNRQSRYKRSRL